MDMFDEESNQSEVCGDCCDVCVTKSDESEYTDCKDELKILIDALSNLGCKGEVKIAE